MRAAVVLLALLLAACAVAQTPVTQLGVPTIINANKGAWTQFSVKISEVLTQMDATDKLFFGVTPFVGDADLYISKTQMPTTPECEHCILKSTSHYDEIKYLAKSDPLWPAAGQPDVFYVGIYAYSQIECSFTVWTTKTNTTLYDAVPQVGWVKWGSVGDITFYEYTLMHDNTNFTISLTPRGADVDLFVTTDPNVRPVNIATSQWYGRRIGFDVIEIRTTDRYYKPAGNKYYIGIQGFSTLGTTFSLYATLDNNYTRIMEGIPLAAQADPYGYKYFTFDLTSDYANHRLVYTVIPLSTGSDPDIFITRNIDNGPPSSTNCEWCKQASGRDVVEIASAPEGRYYIGIRAYARFAHFQITANTEQQSVELTPGVETQGGVHANGYTYFRYFHGNPAETLTITVTPWKGTVELYESMSNSRPDENKYERKGQPMGLERVLRYSLQYGSAPTGFFYLGVKGNTDSNFTILASTNVTYSVLQDGRAQYYQLVTNKYYRYYIFDINHDDLTSNSGIAFTVSSVFGDADLYVSMINDRPTMSNYTWKSEDYLSDTVVIHTDDPNIGHHRRFYVGVYGATYNNQDTYFNILAHKSGSVITLTDGQSLHSTVEYDQYTYFRYNIAETGYTGPIRVSVVTHDTDKRVRAYADDSNNRQPTSHHYKYASTLFGQSFLVIPDAREGMYFIGVYGYSYGGSRNNRTIGFTITASRSFEVLNTNGGNVLRSLTDTNAQDRYRFTIDDGSFLRSPIDFLSVSLTLISGRCRLYLNPSTNRTDDETYTTSDNAVYRNLSPNGNVIMLMKNQEQRHWHHTYNALVQCDEQSDYFISASTSSSVRLQPDQPTYYYNVPSVELEEGVPMLQAVPFQDRFVYALYVPPMTDDEKEDYIISIRILDGKISVYASQDYSIMPNPKNFTVKAENIEEDHTLVFRKDKLDTSSFWGGRLFISVYGAWLPMLHGQANKFEINVHKTSAARYLAQDQPLSQVILDDQFKGDNNVMTHYRVLNSIKHPDDLEVIVESCADLPALAPTFYGSANYWNPNPNNYTYKSETPEHNGRTMKFVQYFVTKKETAHEDRVFYVGVENKPNHQTARHYSIYATTLHDSRPQIRNRQLTGRVDNDRQLGDATVAITVNLASHPPRYRDGTNFLYQVFSREMKDGDEHRLDDINFDTMCAITRHGQQMNIIHDSYNDTQAGTLEILAGPFDPSKRYIVNVFAHSESIFGLATPYHKAYVVYGQFHETYPSPPGMSPAGIFFLVVFILFMVGVAAFATYFIVGFVIKSRQGHKGWEALPNNALWTKLISIITCGKLPRGESYGTLREEPSTSSSMNNDRSGYGTV